MDSSRQRRSTDSDGGGIVDVVRLRAGGGGGGLDRFGHEGGVQDPSLAARRNGVRAGECGRRAGGGGGGVVGARLAVLLLLLLLHPVYMITVVLSVLCADVPQQLSCVPGMPVDYTCSRSK